MTTPAAKKTAASKAAPEPLTFGEALANAMGDIQAMKKTGRNKFGGYDYTPVDDVYESCRKALAKNGVVITQNAIASPSGGAQHIVANTGKGGAEELWIHHRFQFVAFYREMRVDLGCQEVSVRMSMGSQAAGAAASYAMKQFLRAIFLIPMGDYDIDSGQHEEDLQGGKVQPVSRTKATARAPEARNDMNEALKEAPKGIADRELLSEKASYDLFHNVCERMFLCETTDALAELMDENRTYLSRLAEPFKTDMKKEYKAVAEHLKNEAGAVGAGEAVGA